MNKELIEELRRQSKLANEALRYLYKDERYKCSYSEVLDQAADALEAWEKRWEILKGRVSEKVGHRFGNEIRELMRELEKEKP